MNLGQKNMSHSSGGVGGFGINNNSNTSNKSNPQVNDRLKLLKQKQGVASADKPRRDYPNYD